MRLTTNFYYQTKQNRIHEQQVGKLWIAFHSIGNVYPYYEKDSKPIVHLIDLSQVFLRTSEGFCCANIVDIAHSGRHCYWQENYFNMKLSCFTSQTLRNREGQLYLEGPSIIPPLTWYRLVRSPVQTEKRKHHRVPNMIRAKLNNKKFHSEHFQM